MLYQIITLATYLALLTAPLSSYARHSHYDSARTQGCNTNGECLKRGLSPLPPKRSPWRRAEDGTIYTFGYTGGVQQFTVQPGEYAFTVIGAQGGDYEDQSEQHSGGGGGVTNATLVFSTTRELLIAVGSQGLRGSGGGGSLVYYQDTVLVPALVIAGGGGGAENHSDGQDAVPINHGDAGNGGNGGDPGTNGGTGGFGTGSNPMSGMGGNAPATDVAGGSGGGTGYLYGGYAAPSDVSISGNYQPAQGGNPLSQTFAGGASDMYEGSPLGSNGGFGGGGGSGFKGGGGGGGWAGGGGGGAGGAGGGGSAAVFDPAYSNVIAVQDSSYGTGHKGDGLVLIEQIMTFPPPPP